MFKPALLASVAAAAVFTASYADCASASDKLEIAPPPAWVKPPVLATAPAKDAANAPFAVLNRSVQINFAADGDSYFTELAIKIQNPQGLPAGQPYLTWNPVTDTAVVHWVHIIRDGKVIDVLGPKPGLAQTFTVVRRESNLENAMLDGILTAVLQPEGLQVGDTLDYAMTITQRDPVLNGRSEAFLNVPDGTAVAKGDYRVLWTGDKPLRWKKSDDLPAPKITKAKTGNELVLDLIDYKRPDAPEQAPARFNDFGQLQFSQFTAWTDLSALMAPYYAKASSLSENSPLKAEVAKIKAQSSDPQVQAAAALHLVEDQVRYVFLAANEGGYVPADADTTWSRRFGDCKAKTALLLALLRELGIPADAAIVSTGGGDGMDSRLPMAELFDHVIVRAVVAGKTYWLDGTRYGDRTLDTLKVPNFRWALPLRSPGATLEAMAVPPLDKPGFQSSLKIDASAGIDAPAPTHAEVLFRDDDALQVKSMIDSQTPADLEKSLRDYWKGRHDWIDIDKVSAKYDVVTGEAVVTMDGKAKMEWSDVDYTHGRRYLADGYGVGGEFGLKRDPGPHDDAPVALGYPVWETASETIILPNKGKDFVISGETVDKTLSGIAMKRTMAIKDGVFTMDVSTRSLQPEISLAEANAADPQLKQLGKSAVYVNAPYSYAATTDDKKTDKVATTTKPKTVQEFLDRGAQYYRKQQYDKARDDYDAAVKLDPKSSKAMAARAATKFIQKDLTGARADYDAAIALSPRDANLYAYRGSFRSDQKDYDGAIEDYTRALDLNPTDVATRLARGTMFVFKANYSRALDDALAAQSMQPDNPMAAQAAARYNALNGKFEEAETGWRDAVVKWPDNYTTRMQFGELLERCVGKTRDKCVAARAEAVEQYDKGITLQPTAYAYAARARARPEAQEKERMADIDTALSLDPQSPAAHFVRAGIYVGHKDYDKALVDLDTMLEGNPQDIQALEARAYVYERLNRYDDQITDLTAEVAAWPQSGTPLNSLCWARATKKRDLDKAMENCNAALKISPDNAAFLDSRGLVNIQLGKFDDSITDYDAAIKSAGPFASALYGRGIARLRKGLTKEGKADLVAARKLDIEVDKNYAGYGVTP